jgi:uncharacterized membrane protein
MDIGPVEYLVVKFPGSQFTGEIAPALGDLVDAGLVRIIDLAFVTKDAEGNVASVEMENADSSVFQAFERLTAEHGGLLNDDDILGAGEQLEPGSSAALLVWEDVWATRFVQTLENANAELITIQRIPREIVKAALEYDATARAGAEA